jgi:hypothetical protein
LISDIPAGDGKTANLFYSVESENKRRRGLENGKVRGRDLENEKVKGRLEREKVRGMKVESENERRGS